MYSKVYIKKSSICSGLGIFASKNICKGDIISWYYGKVVKCKKLKHKKYKYNKNIIKYNCINKKEYIIGISDLKNLKGKGLAHIANDAIYFGLTGKTNNSYFIYDGKYVLLLAYRNINKNEEILVSYGLEYWIKENNYKHSVVKNIYNYKFKKTINILYYLEKLIKDYFLCNIYEIKNINNNYRIYFKLINEKRWCINYNIWHYDDSFYICFKKDINGLINIYYSCVTCKDNDYSFLIDKTDINIFDLLD